MHPRQYPPLPKSMEIYIYTFSKVMYTCVTSADQKDAPSYFEVAADKLCESNSWRGTAASVDACMQVIMSAGGSCSQAYFMFDQQYDQCGCVTNAELDCADPEYQTVYGGGKIYAMQAQRCPSCFKKSLSSMKEQE